MIPPAVPPVSCRLEMLPGRSVAEQLAVAHELGFDGVALPGRFLETWLPELRICQVDSPVQRAGVSLGFKGSLLSPHDAVRGDCRDSLLRLLDVCAELQAGWVNVPPCLIQDHPDRLTDAGAFSLTDRLDALLLEQLPDLGDAARDRGLLFLLEPVNRYESDYLNSIVHAARLCRALAHPAIGCTADFFHMQLEELDPPNALEQAAPFVRHVHTAGNTRAEPGSGSLDLKPGFRALKAGAYAGWLEIECRQLTGPARDTLPKAAHYLRTTWSNA